MSGIRIKKKLYIGKPRRKSSVAPGSRMECWGRNAPKPILLEEIVAGNMQRLVSPDKELNRVLGGGIVPGSCARGRSAGDW